MTYAYQLLLKILQENFGVFIFEDDQEDFSISDYLPDSLSFIQFIVTIEEEIGSELPDDFLNFEILSSAKGFAEKLEFFVESSQGDPSSNGNNFDRANKYT